MAKKIETLVTLTDDIDGSKGDRTITFSFDGTNYEIDLGKRNASALEKAFAPYIGAARKAKPGRSRKPGRGTQNPAKARRDLSEVRTWANDNGHVVSARGRIPTAILDAYDAAH